MLVQSGEGSQVLRMCSVASALNADICRHFVTMSEDMRRRKRVEFTIHSHERILVKHSATDPSLRCPVCGVVLITPEEAAAVAQRVVAHLEASECNKEEPQD